MRTEKPAKGGKYAPFEAMPFIIYYNSCKFAFLTKQYVAEKTNDIFGFDSPLSFRDDFFLDMGERRGRTDFDIDAVKPRFRLADGQKRDVFSLCVGYRHFCGGGHYGDYFHCQIQPPFITAQIWLAQFPVFFRRP